MFKMKLPIDRLNDLPTVKLNDIPKYTSFKKFQNEWLSDFKEWNFYYNELDELDFLNEVQQEMFKYFLKINDFDNSVCFKDVTCLVEVKYNDGDENFKETYFYGLEKKEILKKLNKKQYYPFEFEIQKSLNILNERFSLYFNDNDFNIEDFKRSSVAYVLQRCGILDKFTKGAYSRSDFIISYENMQMFYTCCACSFIDFYFNHKNDYSFRGEFVNNEVFSKNRFVMFNDIVYNNFKHSLLKINNYIEDYKRNKNNTDNEVLEVKPILQIEEESVQKSKFSLAEKIYILKELGVLTKFNRKTLKISEQAEIVNELLGGSKKNAEKYLSDINKDNDALKDKREEKAKTFLNSKGV